MSDTPRTEDAKFSGIHAHPDEEYVDADFARELERELASETKWAHEYHEKVKELEAENARLSKIIHEAYQPLAKCFHGEWDECNVEHAYFVLKSA
jgi:hypothetical protein